MSVGTETGTGYSPYKEKREQELRRAMWLAGVFDNNLGVVVSFTNPKTKNLRMSISKTSANPLLPTKLHATSGVGHVRMTRRGLRWSLERTQDIRRFLLLIEPYSRARREEIQLLYRMTDPENTPEDRERIYKEWTDYQTSMRIA